MRKLLLLPLLLGSCAGLHAAPPAGHGTFAIWYNDNYDLLKVPYIVGGQVVVQWKDVEPAQGKYDFSPIAQELHKLRELKLKTTVQINGNQKPAWLFAKVPHHPEKLSQQVRDKAGTLMYWHPAYLGAYTNMLNAFAEFIAKSNDRDALLGIRLNFDAVGTEHFTIPESALNLSKWIVPPGAQQGPAWSKALVEAYEKTVVDTYVARFSPYVKIFVRNNVKPEIAEKYRADFASGKLGWFHTSSEAEPRSTSTEIQYQRFYDDCRSGKTVGYAEPWASAWGDHGQVDHRWCSPPQWNYWRSLIDLHCGVSYVALYANDLAVAVKGTYHSGKHQYDEQKDKLGYQKEFEEAFKFTSKYAGYHASPEESPGAWVAFRQNSTILGENVPPKGRALNIFTNDYNFLMERLPDKTTGAHNIGPDAQRQGAWARLLPAGESLRVKANERFAKSLKTAKVLVTYLDKADKPGSSFEIAAGKAKTTVALKNTVRWQTFTVDLPEGLPALEPSGAQVKLTAGAAPVYFHMVEVQR